MGIRYYAYPVRHELIETAKSLPRAFIGRDPLMDAWGPVQEKPRMLYLDKCWREFQFMFRDHSGPAGTLFEGQVTTAPEGWHYAYTSVLDPIQVEEIAADLSTVTGEDIHIWLEGYRLFASDNPTRDDLDYVMGYLADAQEFTTRLAQDGDGLVYMIG